MARNGGADRPEVERGEGRPEEDQPATGGDDARESIWSILSKYKRWYFGLFTGQIVVAAIWLTQRAIADESLPGVSDKILSVWQNMAPVAISSAAIALALTDIWGTAMVIASWLEGELKKRRQREQKQIQARIDEAVKARLEEAVQARVEEAVEVAVESTRAEEREAGRQFRNRLLDWSQRRETAAAAGEEFNEPPPDIGDPDNEDTQLDE